MKKVVAIIVMVIMCCMLLIGCSSNHATITADSGRFLRIDDDKFGAFCQIIVDKETRVMYLFRKHGYGGGLTVMVDADGKPLTYMGTY